MRKDGTKTQFENISYTRAVALQEVGTWWLEEVHEAVLEGSMTVEGAGKMISIG